MPLDTYDLTRFMNAQEHIFDSVLKELRAGTKRGHWMWFIFPQFQGLGRSATANFYAIGSFAEAQAYLAHPTLGKRLRYCTELVLNNGQTLNKIFRFPDDMKFRSSMTLFAKADEAEDNIFIRALLEKCGSPDQSTLDLLMKKQN